MADNKTRTAGMPASSNARVVRKDVSSLSKAEVQQELAKILLAKQRRADYQKNRNKTPEAMEARKNYNRGRYAYQKELLKLAEKQGLLPEGFKSTGTRGARS